MADYTAPFHMPHMTSEEFDKRKAEYIKKHGYTVTIPGPEDIIHYPTEKPMTPQEELAWKKKAYNQFTPERKEEIEYIKKRRKEKYLAMLGSPTPKVLNSRASIITAVDDAQDATSVTAAAGTLMYMAASKGVKKIIAGPLGFITKAASALNFVNKALIPEHRLAKTKKDMEKATKNGTKSSKAKMRTEEKMKKQGLSPKQIKRAQNMAKEAAKLKGGGWKGKAIEGLQVTDNVYGKGISLGPLMSLPEQFASGVARAAAGKTVHLKKPDIDVGHWGRVAQKAARDWLAFGVLGEFHTKEEHHSPMALFQYPGVLSSFMNDEELAQMHIALFLSHQINHMTAGTIDPLAGELSIEDIELKAPEPTNILTLEVIRELGDDPRESCVWPSTGETWSNAADLIGESAGQLTESLNEYLARNAHNVLGWAVEKHAVAAGLYSLENIGGTGILEIEPTPTSRAINSLQNANFCLDEEITSGQEQIFAQWLQRCDDKDYTPNTREVLDFAQRHCGFTFVQHYF